MSTKLPFVLHFRIASSGGVHPLLTHPFEISKTSPLRHSGQCNRALIMNGTELDWRKCLSASGLKPTRNKAGVEEEINDTRAIAMILSQHKDNSFLRVASGKFVVIGYNSPTDEVCFRYFGDFHEEDGIFYSNQLWKWGKTATTFYNGRSHRDYYDAETNNWRETDVASLDPSLESKKKTTKIVVSPPLLT